MILDKDVLGQGFGEQVSNLFIGVYREGFNLVMMEIFTKMMIAYIDILCPRDEFGVVASLQVPALSSNTLQNT